MSDYIREWVPLLPCPFCGGEKLLTTTNEFGGFCFTCENCDVVGPPSDYDPQQMREAWNTRADAALAEIGGARDAGERDDSTPVDVSDKTKTTYFDSVPAIEAEMKLHKGRESDDRS